MDMNDMEKFILLMVEDNIKPLLGKTLHDMFYILKGKRNAYFEFLNVGFILRTLFFLISAIYTH